MNDRINLSSHCPEHLQVLAKLLPRIAAGELEEITKPYLIRTYCIAPPTAITVVEILLTNKIVKRDYNRPCVVLSKGLERAKVLYQKIQKDLEDIFNATDRM